MLHPDPCLGVQADGNKGKNGARAGGIGTKELADCQRVGLRGLEPPAFGLRIFDSDEPACRLRLAHFNVVPAYSYGKGSFTFIASDYENNEILSGLYRWGITHLQFVIE
jgi:hypothetical protein